MDTFSSCATSAGTQRYSQRFDHLAADFFRDRFGLHMSSIGIGTYLGAVSEEASAGYVAAIIEALGSGCNVIDTAINYRHMHSERDIGRALQRLALARDEVIICTKGGFLPFDGAPPQDVAAFTQELIYRLDLDPLEMVGGIHCLAPAFLQEQIGQSLQNLALETLDVYYLHNPETQLRFVTREEFQMRLGAAFAHLEQEVADGRIRLYGVATWDGLGQKPADTGYLSLAELWRTAVDVGGEKHHFRFLQFPYNLGMTAAVTNANQPIEGVLMGEERTLPLLAAARQLGLVAVGSAGLMQSSILGQLPPELTAALGDLPHDAQTAIHFNRSTPGLTTTLVGMAQVAHVRENMQAGHISALPPAEFFRLFQPQ